LKAMHQRKRSAVSTAATAIIIVIIIIAAAGAYYLYSSSTAPQQSSTTVQPVTLNLIMFTDPANQWIKWAGQQFALQHPGVTVNVVGQPFGSYIQTEINAEKTGSSTYDILGFTSTTALSLLPYLVNLSPVISINSSDIPYPQLAFGGLYRNASSGQTEMIGVPYDSSTFTIFYRTDIFDNPSLNASFYEEYHVPLDPHHWTSWQDAINADNFLVKETHTVKYGILTDAQQAHDIIDTFPAIFGYYYARNSTLNGGTVGGIINYNIMFMGKAPPGKPPLPSFNNSAGVQALEVFYKLVQYDPQPFSVINYGTIGTTFASGNAAGAIMFTPENPTLIAPGSNVTGKYSIAEFPGGYSETGTDFFGVSKYSQHQQLAEQFIQFLINPTINAKLYYQTGEFPISKQAVAMINANQSVPLWERNLVLNVYSTAATGWANPPNIPPTAPTLIPTFNSAVYNFLQGDGSVSSAIAALNQAAAAWAKAVGY